MPATTTTTTTTSGGCTTTETTTVSVAEPAPAPAPAPAEAAAAYTPLEMPTPPGPTEIDEWQAKCTEVPMEPLLPILDCHHHFFNWAVCSAGDGEIPVPDAFRAQFTNMPGFEPMFGVRNQVYKTRKSHKPEDWAAGKVVSHKYLPDEFLADAKGNNIVGTLFEECFYMIDLSVMESNPLFLSLGEVKAVQKIKDAHSNKDTKLCTGMNAHVSLEYGAEACEPLLQEMTKFGVVKGIRDSGAAWPEYPEMFSPGLGPGWAGAKFNEIYDLPAFREGYALLEKYGLSFDAWVSHKQIPMVTRLAKAFPNIPICLCHLGSPAFLDGLTNKPHDDYETVLAEWKTYIDEAAKVPNMVCKSDALPMAYGPHDWYNRPTPPTSAEVAQRLAPFYMYTIEKFGVDRVMFASNFPMDRSGCSYTCLWNAYKIMTKDMTMADRNKLFHDNAVKFYRL